MPCQHRVVSNAMKVGILGHVGNENLGDEAIIAAVIQNIRRLRPDTKIYGFTLNPADTEQRHGIPSFPIRWGTRERGSPDSTIKESRHPEPSTDLSMKSRLKESLKKIPLLHAMVRGTWRAFEVIPKFGRELVFLLKSWRHTKGLDLLVIAGSHQLNDYVGGPWSFPYTVLKWTLLARAAGARIVFLSMGAGPIQTWLGQRFICYALRIASYRSYRDETSRQVVEFLCARHADQVIPDLAFSLDLPPIAHKSTGGRRAIVGINPLPFYAEYWHTTDRQKYGIYIEKLAAFADWLVEGDCEVRFIPTQLRVDPAVIADVRDRMRYNNVPKFQNMVVEPTIQCLDELMSALAELDLMVATRYHGILLALAVQVPVLAIAYHDKSRDLMGWLAQGHHVLDGEIFTADALKKQFTQLRTESETIRRTLQEQIPIFRSLVEKQYDDVFERITRDK